MHSKIEKLLSKLEDQEHKANNNTDTASCLKSLYCKLQHSKPVDSKQVWIVK